jgi:O-acetyl-ADP-ribose deacetylase (regulator of RNase III)
LFTERDDMKKPSNFITPGILRFVKGDATLPTGSSMQYILQVCNNEGKYGAGFSGALSSRYPIVEQQYRKWWRECFGKLNLGDIQVIQVRSDIAVINMIAQNGVVSKDNPTPIDYDALEKCLSKAGIEISENSASAHMPRIGCGLAGGKWEEVEPKVKEQLLKRGINVNVYDLPD